MNAKLSNRSIKRAMRSIATFFLVVSSLCALQSPARAQDATALLDNAVTTMSTVQSFAFALSTVQGQSTILQNLELSGVEGTVQRPDRFQAKITAKLAFIEVDVRMIGIGGNLWVTDPLSDSDSYVNLSSEGGGGSGEVDTLTALLNPDRLLLAAVDLVENSTIDGTEEINDVPVTRIKGTVDLSNIEQFATATPNMLSDLLILGEMPITIWIDDAGHVVSLDFDVPVTIDEPIA
jgi:lipoprotein LprA